ncbi:MAG: hypothetical protein R3E90_13170 [Marinicella sp.]
MKKILLFLCVFSVVSYAEEVYESDSYYLITGKPVKMKFLHHNSDSEVDRPPSWLLSLKNVKVIEGDAGEYPKKIKVEVRSRSDIAILNSDEIVLLVDGNSKAPNVLYWEKVSKIICLPNEGIAEAYKDYYFENKWEKNDMSCRFIR